MNLPEWWHKHVYQRKMDAAFPVIALLENQRRLNLEELVNLAEQSESRVRKSLEFLYGEGLISGNFLLSPKARYHERYLLTGEGHKAFRGKNTATPPRGQS